MRRRLVKFRALVHAYSSHRRHLKVQARPSPSPGSQACPVWVQGHQGWGGALSPQEETVGLGFESLLATPQLCELGPP